MTPLEKLRLQIKAKPESLLGKKITEEEWILHDCHLTAEDSCDFCEAYALQEWGDDYDDDQKQRDDEQEKKEMDDYFTNPLEH